LQFECEVKVKKGTNFTLKARNTNHAKHFDHVYSMGYNMVRRKLRMCGEVSA